MKLSKIFWVGLMISVTTVAFIIGLLYLQEISLKKSNFVFTIILDNVQGLNEGDNVTMLGKRIGKVTRTKIIGQKIAVEVSIDNSFAFRIPIDSKIEVKSEGIMGEKYVSISPGMDTKNYILAGETVQGTREKDLSEITPGIVPLTHDLGVFARRLKATLGEEEKDRIKGIIRNVEQLTSELTSLTREFKGSLSEEDKENIHVFTRNLKTISDSLKLEMDTGMESIATILSDVNDVTSKLKDKTDTFTQSLDKLNEGSRIFVESAESFKTITEELAQVAEQLKGTTGTLPRLLNDDKVYNNLDSLINDIRFVVDDFKENPGRYLKAYMKAKKDE